MSAVDGPVIYVASKIKHAELWRHMRNVGHWKINSSWIDVVRFQSRSGPTPETWYVNVEQAARCDALIFLCEEDEYYAGCLVEIGAALSHNKPVIVVLKDGQAPNERWSWIKHPLVSCVTTYDLAKAYDLAKERIKQQ